MIPLKQRKLRQAVSFPKIQPKDFYELWQWTQRTFEDIYLKITQEDVNVPLGGILFTVLTEVQLERYYPKTFQKMNGQPLRESQLKEEITGPITLANTVIGSYQGYTRVNTPGYLTNKKE